MATNDGKKIAFLFPGQGSQFLGMTKGFRDLDPQCGELMALAEKASGLPLTTLCDEGPMEELTRTLHLQPAMTAANLICHQALVKAGVKADYCCGHSLGEYGALCAAGVLSVEDTLKLVTERGRLMEREAAAHPGAMRAVVKLGIEEVEEIIAQVRSGVLCVANHNSAQQIVISGEEGPVEEAAKLVADRGGKAIPLKVSGPWHSELIGGAVADFAAAMAKIDFRAPAVPILFNVTAATETDPAAIREIMARQISSRVRWFETVQRLMAEDVRIFIEVGPKNVLTGLLKKIIPDGYAHQALQVDSPETLAACLAEIAGG
ncbi:MAG: ACP S-malonyltransferase [Desulfobulbaceae bacterium]|nr:ACP S-malonyltransferase [Desulfobulbaceae bacterium]